MKENRMHIRLTENEMKKIKKKAAKHNMSVSPYLRKSAKNFKIVFLDTNGVLINELSQIGNEINQLTRLANSGVLKKVDLTNIRAELSNIVKQLQEMKIRIK